MPAMRVSLTARYVSRPTIDFGRQRASGPRARLGLGRGATVYHRPRAARHERACIAESITALRQVPRTDLVDDGDGHFTGRCTVEGDDPAGLGLLRLELLHDHPPGGLVQADPLVLHAGAHVVGDDVADEVLAPAGGADTAALVGVRARPDDRRISDPTPLLVGHPAGGRPGPVPGRTP